MHNQGNHKYRKLDFLLVIVTVVGLAMAATLTLHVHALSSKSDPVKEIIASKLKQ
ncbi:MAG TPA: hypothetical protein PLZ16_06845 [Gammaproteobacteria bacterium]|nr:hypothetical protein [Gammaproteobacteria bacterium]